MKDEKKGGKEGDREVEEVLGREERAAWNR